MLRKIKEAFKAWRRGDVRINKGAQRGRIYAKKGEVPKAPPGGTIMHQGVPMKVKSIKIRVYRAATDTWEEIDG